MSRRTGFFVALVIAGLALAAAPAAFSYEYSYARVVRLSYVEGDVQVARPDQQSWETAILNLPIQQGYTLATGQGRAEVEFESGATARIADNTVLQFTELALANGGRITKLTLTQGTATFYANLSREDSFVVLTPQLQVTIAGNARFRLDAYGQETRVSVLKGDVAVDSSAGSNRLTKGHTLIYHSDQAEQVQLERNAKPDEWDRWVANRDDGVVTARNASGRYVSSPYSYGLADLASYGNWLYVSGYGYGWQPWGISTGWVPYFNGRWAWFPGLGWTWLSFEPWGWMPYHFGRWLFSPVFGWVWVPGQFNTWSPALVSWVRVGDRIGWCPMGPHDLRGQAPKNSNGGVVVTNTSTGLIGGGHERLNLTKNEQVRFVDEPPVPEGVRAVSSAMGAHPGIVFDPREGKFVNNPAAPAQPNASTGAAATSTPAPRGASGSTTATPFGPAQPIATRPSRQSSPSSRPNITPAPRGETKHSASSTSKSQHSSGRTESSRPAPAPRTESTAPRPASPSPAPRGESHSSGGHPHGRP